MDVILTTASKTLKQIRTEVAADSSVFSARLLAGDEPAGPDGYSVSAEGYSDLFSAACGGDVSGSEIYQQGLEYIFEGFLLHRDQSRMLKKDTSEFPILAGDHMYARGLVAIASLEDLYCIEALAELMRACSYVQGEKLDPSLALKAWAITTLQLAARARAGGKGPAEPAALARMVRNRPGGEELDRRLEELLAAIPEGRRQALRKQINDLESGLLPGSGPLSGSNLLPDLNDLPDSNSAKGD